VYTFKLYNTGSDHNDISDFAHLRKYIFLKLFVRTDIQTNVYSVVCVLVPKLIGVVCRCGGVIKNQKRRFFGLYAHCLCKGWG
jgi:hypothetical protein